MNPGNQGKRPRNKSQYGTQLEEKQNLKKLYGIREEQLKNYYDRANRKKGRTGAEMIRMLESRLDNAAYRAGFAETRRHARQMASHRFFLVNGRAVNIPSYQLRIGDKVTIKESKRKQSYFGTFEKKMENAQAPSWMKLEDKGYSFKVTGEPNAEEANTGVHIQSIVELLAR